MKDLQGNNLHVGDIVYCCVNGRSKRLTKSRVIEIGPTGKTCRLKGTHSFSNKTSATIVKAYNQADNFDEPID